MFFYCPLATHLYQTKSRTGQHFCQVILQGPGQDGPTSGGPVGLSVDAGQLRLMVIWTDTVLTCPCPPFFLFSLFLFRIPSLSSQLSSGARALTCDGQDKDGKVVQIGG